ncbi:MAG TPA: hypothetical protein VJ438_06535 [Candidatus Nanoarchaeia archaeon]|nr:hypothetical protein [Candidatus Nanoarchaeia archaeon]
MNKYGKIAISEILILIIGMIAVVYIIGIGSILIVKAEPAAARCNFDSQCAPNYECVGGFCIAKPKTPLNPQTGLEEAIGQAQESEGQSWESLLGLAPLVGVIKGKTPDAAPPAKVSTTPDPVSAPASVSPPGSLSAAQLKQIGYDGYTYQADSNYLGGGFYEKEGHRVSAGALRGQVSSPATVTEKGGWGAIGKAFASAAGIWAAVRYIAPMFGASESQSKALALAVSLGTLFGKTVANLGAKGIGPKWFTKPGAAFWTGAIVTVLVLLIAWKNEGERKVDFKCLQWDAPTGGDNCQKCNQFTNFPCSEYQCKSLGQACELINKGTKEEKCVWINPQDVDPPVIQTWNQPLLEGYKYTPDSAINPPDRGVKIIAPTSDTCVPAFTPLAFGIITDEPAKCKISYENVLNISDMDYYFGGSSVLLYNHTQTLSLPGVQNVEQENANITLENDGEFSLFVRCIDANGNKNDANFVFKFCVEKGPDNTAPIIVDTSIANNMPVGVGQDQVLLNVYVNEPAECKWSTMDRDYEQMENAMDCKDADSVADAIDLNSKTVYTCRTKLEGIKDKQENKFYFRCKDQPKLSGDKAGDRNVNSESHIFTIFGTQSLVIDKAGPEGIVKDATQAVKVTLTAQTSAGFKEGESICYYKDANSDDKQYVEFFNTVSYTHSTDLYLPEEEYQYIIKCVDLGGNSDTWQVNFTVESDAEAPLIARAFKEDNYLKITTNENATCVYDTKSCSYLFEDGLPMTVGEKKTDHFTDWTTKTKLYIKCKDDFGNQPASDSCSAIIRAI